ncbi:MAG: transglutaminase domain-containing protein [Myxococcales bacterium]|nr:transglutaminase domain-containing protein [Myxococcales bacterium]
MPRFEAGRNTLIRGALASLAALGLALGAARADPPVLHEYVPDLAPLEAVRELEQSQGAPAAIVQGDQVLAAPRRQDAQGPPMQALPGDGMLGEQPGRRSPSFRPDRMTELERALSYFAAFNPTIAPFKRVSSLDAVMLAADGITPILVVADRRRRAVPILEADAEPPDGLPRDRFWGEARLDFGGGSAVPLPSVAPAARLLSLQSEPPLPIEVQRDGADNFFAVLAAGAAGPSEVFVSFLTDAPQGYFASEIPAVPLSGLPPLPLPVPESIAARALDFAQELGLSRDSDLREALSRLTAHFRAFEESAQPPADSGDIFLDLVRSQRGVCRHRAYGFVVTAQALGITARFVQNEAHSWAEVLLPEQGFMRIDLGGAADGLEAHGQSGRSPYQPAGIDTLPRPPAFEQSYSTARRSRGGSGSGAGDGALQGRWLPPLPTGDDGVPRPGAAAAGQPGSSAGDHRAQLQLRLDPVSGRVLRGRTLRVSGRVEAAEGRGVAGLRVEVSLASDERLERLLLGVTLSDGDGRFGRDFGVPADLEAGDYRLMVLTPGNGRYRPALARTPGTAEEYVD